MGWLYFCFRRQLAKMSTDFDRGFIVGAQQTGASQITKTPQLACVSMGTVTIETSAFRSMRKASVNRKNRRATLFRVTENVNAGCDQTVSATVRRQLHREGYYSRVAVHKPVITKMNACLRVQSCKNHRHLCTEMWEKVIWSDDMTVPPSIGHEGSLNGLMSMNRV
uniref:Transposase Tc1-like domain-containing protein n=1 Tax=Lates calcarifer TaxID=8187 RepID=A0A4W6EM72_LATCA